MSHVCSYWLPTSDLLLSSLQSWYSSYSFFWEDFTFKHPGLWKDSKEFLSLLSSHNWPHHLMDWLQSELSKHKSNIYVPNCWVDLSFNLRVNLDFFLFWFCKLQNRPKVFGCNLKSIDCSRFHSNNAQFDEKKKSGINLALKLKSTHHLGT